MGTYLFDSELAVKIGVEEAILTNNIIFWLQHNIANRKHFYDGRYWTFNTVQAFGELFPFWTTKQLRRTMESLYSKNVLMKGNYNKTSFDRTGWYSLTDEYIYLLHLPKTANGLPERSNGIAEKGNTIPNNNTDSKKSLSNDKDSNDLLFNIPAKFKKPTIEELEIYFEGQGSSKSLAKKFYNFYESKGWYVGKSKMKKWRAAAANWIEDNTQAATNNTDQQKGSTISL